ESARQVNELDRHVMETGEPGTSERSLCLPGGPQQDFAATRSPFRDQDGNIIGVIGISRDVTQQRRAQEALRASEERYRAFVDHATDALFLHADRGVVVDVNTQACLSLRYSRDELIGMTPADFDPDVNPEFLEMVRAKLAAGETLSFDSRHRRKDGSTFPVEVRIRAFSVNGKNFSLSFVRDITSRKAAENALRESEARIKAAQRVAGLGVWEWDLQDKVWWSEELCRIYGHDPASYTPSLSGFLSHIPLGEHQKLRSAIQETIRSAAPYRLEHQFSRADGQVRWMYTEGFLDRDDAGNPSRLWGVCRDITEQKLAEDVLRRSHEIANQHQIEIAHLSRVASVGEMASSLAHDLNQPLTAVLSYAGVCMDAARAGKPAAEMAEHLQELCKEANRAAEIIRRLRAFTRRQTPQRQVQQLPPRLQEAVDLMRFQLQRAGVKPQFQFSRDLPPVEIDSVQIQQVLINLIQNALDAMEGLKKDQRKLIVKTDCAAAGNVRVCVVDAGSGVPREVSTKIFDSFFTTKQHGLGLGLPICRSIIESHGGQLSALPNPDRGMTFEFVLPAAAVGG
ncbi:MAG: PAS domain S-box protein, partial [Tepidisphaeraceae bacterium]